MSDWQKILRDESISTLEELKSYVAERFGEVAAEREIDVEALGPAFDNFQMRITRESLSQITDVGDANWNQFIPTVQELEIVDGVIDSLDEDGDSPVPNITHRYPDRALFLVSPVCASTAGVRRIWKLSNAGLRASTSITSWPNRSASFSRLSTPSRKTCCHSLIATLLPAYRRVGGTVSGK